jgi:hypothetical protein
MQFIFRLLTFPVTGPIYGMRFILEQIREQALAEMLTEEQIETLLIEASLQHQAGEISDEEYEEIENQLLEQWNTLRTLSQPAYDYEHEYGEDAPAEVVEQEQDEDRA